MRINSRSHACRDVRSRCGLTLVPPLAVVLLASSLAAAPALAKLKFMDSPGFRALELLLRGGPAIGGVQLCEQLLQFRRHLGILVGVGLVGRAGDDDG